MQTQMQYDMMSAFKAMIPTEIPEPSPIEDVAAYKPEQSWNYEFGARSELLPGRLNAELTFFYMDITDLQLTKFVNSGNGRVLTNAGSARSLGVEASLRAYLLEGLTADLPRLRHGPGRLCRKLYPLHAAPYRQPRPPVRQTFPRPVARPVLRLGQPQRDGENLLDRAE